MCFSSSAVILEKNLHGHDKDAIMSQTRKLWTIKEYASVLGIQLCGMIVALLKLMLLNLAS